MKDDKKKLDLVVALGGGKDVPEATGSGEVDEEPKEGREALVAAIKAFREALDAKDDEAAADALETAVASC